jgi:hypothetical protein
MIGLLTQKMIATLGDKLVSRKDSEFGFMIPVFRFGFGLEFCIDY